jgi:hypothetical protein
MIEQLALQGLVTAIVALPAAMAGTKATMNGMAKRQQRQSEKLDKMDDKLDTTSERLTRVEVIVQNVQSNCALHFRRKYPEDDSELTNRRDGEE